MDSHLFSEGDDSTRRERVVAQQRARTHLSEQRLSSSLRSRASPSAARRPVPRGRPSSPGSTPARAHTHTHTRLGLRRLSCPETTSRIHEICTFKMLKIKINNPNVMHKKPYNLSHELQMPEYKKKKEKKKSCNKSFTTNTQTCAESHLTSLHFPLGREPKAARLCFSP